MISRNAADVSPRARRFATSAAALLTLCAAIGTALSPYLLIEHPLLLLALNPHSRHVVLVANRVERWQAVVVATLRRGLNFIGIYAVANVYGSLFVGWFETRRPWVSRLIGYVEAIYARIGAWLVVFVPIYSVAAFAGLARMSPRKFGLAIIPGQVAFTMALLSFGAAIETWTDPVIAFVAKYSLEATFVAVLLVTVQQLWSRYARRG